METTIQSINLITTNPQVRNGRPCIAGTSLEVAVVAIAKIVHGQSPEEIAADYNLSLPQVYAALAYYYEHKDEMDAMIQQRHELSKKIKEKLSNAYPSQLISQEIPADTAIAKETEAWDILSGEALLNFEAELG